MKYLLLFAVVALHVEPCNSLSLLAHPYSPYLLGGLGTVVCILPACYIFYPAYANVEGGLGCTSTVLAGNDDKNNQDNILSLVIPAYNEADRLPIMLDATLEYMNTNRRGITQLFNDVCGQANGDLSKPVQCELVIVNDGSTDGTENVIRKYATKNIMNGDIVKLVSMHKNSGKGGAVKTGMLQSSGQLCLMVDADGATEINDGLPKVLKQMKDLMDEKQSKLGYLPPAAVFGSRAHLEDESCASRSRIRTFLMHSFHFFVKTLCSPRIKDTQCGFKLFTRSAVAVLFTNLHLRRWAFDTELVVIAEKLNVSLSEVGVVWNEVDGSKLDINKLALALVSLGMLRDMICVRACYFLGIWKLKR